MKNILLIEDEDNLNRGISLKLQKEGYTVFSAATVAEGLSLFQANTIDLVICDIGLPDGSGLDLCASIRQKSDVLFLFLTALDTEVDMITGYEMGADDYVTKPFGNRELIARVKANLRRSDIAPVTNNEKDGNNQVYGDLNIDFDRYEVTKRGEVINLTLREFELLTFLATQTPTIFTRENLLEKVWGYEYFGDVRAVDVTIRRLREKIEDDPSKPKYIVTKRGVGYYFNC